MKILNLYAGLGGNRKLWTGCTVTAVERDSKIAEVYKGQHPGDVVIEADAHEYLLNHAQEFDFIWSSPPCQSHSRMIRGGRNRKARYPDLRLYEEIIFLQENFPGTWVVENVIPYYKPLIPYQTIGRHSFWANFTIPKIEAPEIKNFITGLDVEAKHKMQEWLGIYYEGNIFYEGNHCITQVLRNCLHPNIGLAVLDAARNEKNQQGLLFEEGELFKGE